MRTTSFTIILALALIIASFVGIIAYYTFAPTPPNLPSGRGGNESISPPLGGGVRGGASPSRPTITASDPLRGNPTAPLTIVEFGDFQCAACAEVEPALLSVLDQYKGQVKLVWKDLPNARVHPLAQRAAQAARCADEQGKFWEYHDLLLQRQNSVAQSFSSDIRPEGLSYFITFARELGLNMDSFTECLETGRTIDTVTRSLNEAILLRVDATPYFFIGERRFSGAVSEEELTAIIETTLKSLAL